MYYVVLFRKDPPFQTDPLHNSKIQIEQQTPAPCGMIASDGSPMTRDCIPDPKVRTWVPTLFRGGKGNLLDRNFKPYMYLHLYRIIYTCVLYKINK